MGWGAASSPCLNMQLCTRSSGEKEKVEKKKDPAWSPENRTQVALSAFLCELFEWNPCFLLQGLNILPSIPRCWGLALPQWEVCRRPEPRLSSTHPPSRAGGGEGGLFQCPHLPAGGF